MKLIFTPLAQRDIQNIKNYIADILQNKSASKKNVKDIFKGCMLLKEQPLLGMSVLEKSGWKNEYRYLVIGKYLAFYKVDEQNIKVYRILDSRTDYIKKLF